MSVWSYFSRDPLKDFGYEVGEEIAADGGRSPWKLYKGKRKSGGEEVAVFVHLKSASSDKNLDLAQNAVKRLKTLRHPLVLTYIDSFENDKVVYLVTEAVIPLEMKLQDCEATLNKQQLEMYVSLGLFNITKAVSFLNNEASLCHFNICSASVFVTPSGEWKLGGVEYVASWSPPASLPSKRPALQVYDPPEAQQASKRKSITSWSSDAWSLGCLVWEIYNGRLLKTSSLRSPEKINKSLVRVYCELVGADPKARPNASEMLDRERRSSGYFKNDLIDAVIFIEEIHLKTAPEVSSFCNKLNATLDKFPTDIKTHKILPHLIKTFEFGNAGAAVLSPLLKLAKNLPEREYETKVVPCILKLLGSTERSTRLKLLSQMPQFASHLSATVVNQQIYPQLVFGFKDSNASIREHTVKVMLHLAEKLNHNNLNVDLLKHFAFLQVKDEQGGIRTNTTICLGKIASHLDPATRRKILVPACTRAMKDSFPPARMAGISSLACAQHFFPVEDISHKVLPSLCTLIVDPEKEVRDYAFKSIRGFLSKLERLSEDPSLKETMEADVDAESTSVSQSASWTNWAVSAVKSSFYRSKKSTLVSEKLKVEEREPESKPNGNGLRVTLDEEQTNKTENTDGWDDDDDDDDDEWNNEDWNEPDEEPCNREQDISFAKTDKPCLSRKSSSSSSDWDSTWEDSFSIKK